MTTASSHSAFELVATRPVEALNLEVQSYRHRKTGAQHIHLAADDDQNVFLVGFRTVPQDSSGVAHILEHTALCGSRNYPVRDPFFMMTRRSLNTFMNAFTSSDWTAYPFASRNRKDFDNLLKIYLDAAFFPSLEELDFAQEGHRVEFAETDNPDSDLVFKGVVFNEMKGAMSSPVANLYQTLTRELFPTVTYHHNSGGDPAHIPDLTYEQLKAFHASHYHPSNAIFMTYGDIKAAEHQAQFEEMALKDFDALELDIAVPDEQRYSAPKQVEDRYALDDGSGTEDKTHIVLGWLLGRSTDMQEVLEGHLLSGVLLDNGASPLRRALETTDLGSAPSPLCGLQDSTREMIFACGLEGTNPDKAEQVEQLILEVLEQVARDGVEPALVEAVLHQLELQQREISGDGFPFGLQLIVNALSPAIHGADAAAAIDIDPILNHLRESIKNPDYIKGLTRRLLDNNHRVRLVMSPDTELSAEQAAAEAARLAKIKKGLGEEEKQRIIEQAHALLARQNQQDDPDMLPKVGLEDIPKELNIPEGSATTVDGVPATWYSRGTNGLVYQQVIVDLPPLDDSLLSLMPLYTDVVTEVGSGGRDYLTTQALQSAVTGGLSASSPVRGAMDDMQNYRGLYVLSGKALARNTSPLSSLLVETFESARFDELDRIRELVTQERMHREQSVTNSGHALAMAAATSAITPSAALNHRWNGLEGVRQLKALDDANKERENLEQFAEHLVALRDSLISAPRQFLVIGEEEQREALHDQLSQHWHDIEQGSESAPFTLSAPGAAVNQAWCTSTQVNFCAKAFPTVPMSHADAPALMVLAGFLRNNFLHRAIREQGGAYGGGANFDADNGAFRFFSYRDPRLVETLADFDASIDWLLNNSHEWRLVEEAILGVISTIDKPGSPAGEAKKAFHAMLHGRTPEVRRQYRSRVLEVREVDLKRVAETYLKPELAHTAVITNSTNLEKAGDIGLDKITL